jgi:ketosteroid isomerase-like protein
MKNLAAAVVVLLLGVALGAAHQGNTSDEGGRVLALEKAWNHALAEKDTKALDMLLHNTMVLMDTDGSVQSKGEFLASVKVPDYQPSQATIDQTSVRVYGDTAVVVGIFRVKGTDKGKTFARRERFVDTWIKTNGTWQCVATTAAMIKQAAE